MLVVEAEEAAPFVAEPQQQVEPLRTEPVVAAEHLVVAAKLQPGSCLEPLEACTWQPLLECIVAVASPVVVGVVAEAVAEAAQA